MQLKRIVTIRLFDVYPDDNIYEIAEELESSFQPDLVGLVMTTTFTRQDFASLLKKFPDAKFCAGGIHPTVP